MKKNNAIALVFLTVFAAAIGCAHKAQEKTLDDKLATEKAIQTPDDLRSQSAKLIRNSPNLTEDERVQLDSLRTETSQELKALEQESLKLRSVLMKDIVSTTYNVTEINLLKGNIKKIENKRISITFAAIDKANRILGRNAELNPEFMDEL
jgi:hypothetical protein